MKKILFKKKIFLFSLVALTASATVWAESDPVADTFLSVKEQEKKKKETVSALDNLLKDVKSGAISYVPEDENKYEFPRDEKFFDVTPVSDYKFSLLLDSLLTDTPLDIPDSAVDIVGTPWRDWKKDSFIVDADIDQLMLRFQYVAGKERPQEKPESFYLKVSFYEERFIGEQLGTLSNHNPKSNFNKRDSVVIQHSMPKTDAERGGVAISTSNKKQQRIFLRGRDDTSMVAIIPKKEQRNIKAVVLCPRDYDPWRLRGGYSKLHHTDYELVAIEGNVRAKAEAGVLSGHGAGVAKAHILTTKNLRPAAMSYDESMLQYPSVFLEYKPFGRKAIQLENSSRISMGVAVQTVHHNSFNQKTVSTGFVKMTSREIDMEEELPIKIALNNNERNMFNFRMETGKCYALIKERTLKQQFVKSLLPQEAIKNNKPLK